MARPSPTPHLHLVGEAAAAPPEGDLESVWRAHSRYVAHLALHVLGRDADVDDVVQDVFVAAAGAVGRLRNPSAVRAWLGTVTVRLARRRLRLRRLLSLLALDPEPDYGELAARDADPEQRLLVKRLYQALDELPAKDRIAWTLRHVDGEQLDEVARLCGCSLATAKRRIAAAEVGLAARLEP